MILADIAQEIFALLLVLAILRYAQAKVISSESTTGKALSWILH